MTSKSNYDMGDPRDEHIRILEAEIARLTAERLEIQRAICRTACGDDGSEDDDVRYSVDVIVDHIGELDKRREKHLLEGVQYKREIARLTKENGDFRDWARCAHGFAWAHENNCPRNHGHACNCGLDAFLSRPRPVMDGYRATLRSIAQALGLPAEATGEQVIEAARELVKDRERATEFDFGKALIRKCFGHRLPHEPMWKVIDRFGYVLNKHGDWEMEPVPSSRNAEYYAATRYEYEEARAAIDAIPEAEGK